MASLRFVEGGFFHGNSRWIQDDCLLSALMCRGSGVVELVEIFIANHIFPALFDWLF